jgi:Tfp pilus assembly protein PilN
MVTASVLVEINTTPWTRTRTRDLLDSLERLFLVLSAAFGIGLILVAGLFLVKRHFADQTVTDLAHLAGEDITVAFGVNGSYISSQHSDRNRW